MLPLCDVRRTFEKMAISPARKAVFLKAGLKVSSKKSMIFFKLLAFGFRRTFEKIRHFSGVKTGFIKAGLRVWSIFFRRERRFLLRQGLGFGVKKKKKLKAPGLWFQKDVLKKWAVFRRENRFP